MGYKLNKIYIGQQQVRPAIVWNGDLSKATSQNRTQFSLSGTSYEVVLNPQGTKMFVSFYSGTISEYTLSTPFDITTAGNKTDYGVGYLRQYPNPCFADGGKKLFVGYGNSSTYARYDLGTSYDLSTVTFSSPDATFSMAGDLGIQSVSADGKSYIFKPGTSRSLTYTVSSTARSLVNSQTSLLSSSNVMCGIYCNEGKMLMVMDGTTIKKYELGTPYDLTTLNTTPLQSQSTGLSGNPWGMYVDATGDNIYININNVVYRYNLV